MAKYEYTVQGVDYEVEILEVEGTLAKVTVNGIDFDVEMKQPISVGKTIAKPIAPKPQARSKTCRTGWRGREDMFSTAGNYHNNTSKSW